MRSERATWFVFLSALAWNVCVAQVHDVLCNAGNTSFEASFRTGVTVSIAAQKRSQIPMQFDRKIELELALEPELMLSIWESLVGYTSSDA